VSGRYITFKFYERGVPNTSGTKAKYRNCMHCGSTAHWTAVYKNGMALGVRFCGEHADTAREINARRNA
jgi:hypothetical protein